jgi:ABC-2 type transport system permease protein
VPSGAVGTLARHEYRAAVRSRVLAALLITLVAVTAVSIMVATFDYRTQLADYRAYRDAATAAGVTRVQPLPLVPLQLMRGAIEYIEIIGALIAIALGYLTVSRERGNRTLPLVRSRPVSTGQQTLGAALGAVSLISTLVLATALMAVLAIGVVGRDWINGAEALKLGIGCVASILYMTSFYCLGALLAARSRVLANALVGALVIWLSVVLILPQIGDTLDPDNQVPGGLFKSLNVDKPHEVAILGHFGTYERIRNDVEQASLAKHYERFAFAMLDIKEKYRGLSLGNLFTRKRADVAWILVSTAVLVAGMWWSFRRQPALPRGAN